MSIADIGVAQYLPPSSYETHPNLTGDLITEAMCLPKVRIQITR